MLSEFIQPSELLKAKATYIERAAKYASEVYEKIGLKHELFEGTSMQLSPTMCESIYRNLLSEMVKTNLLISNKFGLIAVIVPLQEIATQKVMFCIQLGVMFPDIDQKTSSDQE